MFSKKITPVAVLCIVLIIGLTQSYSQEKYPSRAIEMVIPWAPGGPADIAGRIFANELTKVLKVPITPAYKAGATATIGGAYVVKAKKDGYTFLVGGTGWLLGSLTLEDVPYDPLKDFIPIAKISTVPNGIFVKSDSPFKTLEDLINSAKKNPRAVSYGTSGAASDGRFNVEILQKAAGIELKHVPFKGTGDVPPAVMGGHVDFGMAQMSVLVPFIKAGNIRALAITGMSKMKDFPDVPTFKDRGFEQTFLSNWNGILVATGVSQNVVETLILASEKAIKTKELAVNFDKVGAMVEYMNSAEFQKMLENEKKAVEVISQELGLKSKK